MIGTDELACVYSALILQDDEIAVTVSIHFKHESYVQNSDIYFSF